MELINNILEVMSNNGIWKFYVLDIGLLLSSITNFIIYKKYKKKLDLGASIISFILFLFNTYLLLLSHIS